MKEFVSYVIYMEPFQINSTLCLNIVLFSIDIGCGATSEVQCISI